MKIRQIALGNQFYKKNSRLWALKNVKKAEESQLRKEFALILLIILCNNILFATFMKCWSRKIENINSK